MTDQEKAAEWIENNYHVNVDGMVVKTVKTIGGTFKTLLCKDDLEAAFVAGMNVLTDTSDELTSKNRD